MTDAIQIVTTTAGKADAEKIARLLVERRLAACVQVGGPIVSCYRWNEQIETSEEWTCTIKTRQELFDRAAAAIREAHPYETPEILATPIIAGDADYLRWMSEETT
ncbi:MAG: divalent-cation tolerance protein CutA [Planctomycetes bacterium]|nr:divalent-cation tolerance protein CutA [Planctomycetota bacterium]